MSGGGRIPRPDAVCKVGGSLIDSGRAPRLLGALRPLAPEIKFVVVPGGGRGANLVRFRFEAGEVAEEIAHWEAVRALDENAEGLARNRHVSLPLVRDRDRLAEVLARQGVAVVAPHAMLRAADPLPHTFAVTSDSIAAWLAIRTRAPKLVLAKARDGMREDDVRTSLLARLGRERRRRRTVEEAATLGIVDDYLPRLLGLGSFSAWLVNGHHPERVEDLIRGERARATELVT